MKLSARSRYGTRLLLDLALYGGQQPVRRKDIAQRQQIPLPYLEHLITPLIVAGIVSSTRGPQGGISLTKSPKDIKLIEAYHILEGSTALVECINRPETCSRSSFCVTRDVWSELKKAMNNVLESITLEDLVERQKKKGEPEELANQSGSSSRSD